MLLLVLFIILYFISKKRGGTMANLICLLYIASLVCLFFHSPSKFFEINFSLLNIIYFIIFYSFLILPWSNFKLSQPTSLTCSKTELAIFRIGVVAGLICFVINLGVFVYLKSFVTDYTMFKSETSEGIANFGKMGGIFAIFDYFTQYTPMFILLLPFHFYFIQKKDSKNSFLALVAALNYPLAGLCRFSRSSTVAFLLIYIFLFVYYYRSFDILYAKKVKRIGIVLIAGFAFILMSITENRFSGDYDRVNDQFIYQDGLVKNRTVNSQLSYFSQWYIYSNIWAPEYSEDKLTHGSREFPLIAIALSKMGVTDKYPDYLEEKLFKHYEYDTASFWGVSTIMLLDLGYVLSILLMVLYSMIVKRIAYKKSISVVDFMPVVFLIIIPVQGIFGSELVNTSWHFMLCFYFIILLINKIFK